MSKLTRALDTLRQDPAFCRGFRRGVGLILAAWVIEQCLICALYPFIVTLLERR